VALDELPELQERERAICPAHDARGPSRQARLRELVGGPPGNPEGVLAGVHKDTVRMTRRHTRAVHPPPIDGLVLSGLAELALGALTGWPYALAIADPDRMRALGIRSIPRLRQWHLDLIALGGLTVLAGTAVPDLPSRVKWPLGVGAWTNAMSFGVLAVRPELRDQPAYRVAVTGSFLAASSGFVGLAHEGFARWRR
jgi:hypothetical protein